MRMIMGLRDWMEQESCYYSKLGGEIKKSEQIKNFQPIIQKQKILGYTFITTIYYYRKVILMKL